MDCLSNTIAILRYFEFRLKMVNPAQMATFNSDEAVDLGPPYSQTNLDGATGFMIKKHRGQSKDVFFQQVS